MNLIISCWPDALEFSLENGNLPLGTILLVEYNIITKVMRLLAVPHRLELLPMLIMLPELLQGVRTKRKVNL